MIVIPAVDMKDGKAVRLTQGRMESAVVYADSILEAASRWVDQGAVRLHLVDLNGAFAGEPLHFKNVEEIAKRFPAISLQVGGGLRTAETVKNYFDSGVSYCILGTVAVKNPDFAIAMCSVFPHKIILGVDARDGKVAVNGWDEKSTLDVETLLQSFHKAKIDSVVYTDVARDGMLGGLNVEGIRKVASLGFNVIASGGLASLNDFDILKNIEGVSGVIAGKALYEGRFTFKDAVSRAAC